MISKMLSMIEKTKMLKNSRRYSKLIPFESIIIVTWNLSVALECRFIVTHERVDPSVFCKQLLSEVFFFNLFSFRVILRWKSFTEQFLHARLAETSRPAYPISLSLSTVAEMITIKKYKRVCTHHNWII